jgi:hypothetical protein
VARACLDRMLPPRLMRELKKSGFRVDRCAEGEHTSLQQYAAACEPFITANVAEILPFIPAYDNCLIDIGQVSSFPVERVVEFIEDAWNKLDIKSKENAHGCHVIVRCDGRHTLSYPNALIAVHPVTGERKHVVSLGGILLEEHLSHLEDEIRCRNFGVAVIPNHLLWEQARVMLSERAIVSTNPDEYELGSLGCCVIDIREIVNLAPGDVADRVYLTWIGLNLRTQHTCRVTLRKHGEPTLDFSPEMDDATEIHSAEPPAYTATPVRKSR